jgi:predicted dehydrogenase
MSLSKLGVGVIGTGMAATPHAKALNDLRDHIDLRGVFSRNAEKCKTFASRFELPFIKNIEDLINDPKLDIIIIITPPNQRLKLVQQFSDAGKHILMEKPVERSSAKAKIIVNLCKEKNVKLGIVFQHRFRESSQKLKKLILSHSLGSIFTVQVQVPWWRDQSYYDEPGRGSYERDGGGVLISQAIHTLDLMLSLTGPVSEVQALSSTSQFHKMESEDFVAGGLKFKSGASGSIFASTSSFPGNTESITLNCEKASAHLQSGVLTIKWLDGRTEKFGETSGTGGGADPMAFPHDWHRDLIDNFVKSVQNKYNSLISGEEALNVHELIDALIESSNKGKLITI